MVMSTRMAPYRAQRVGISRRMVLCLRQRTALSLREGDGYRVIIGWNLIEGVGTVDELHRCSDRVYNVSCIVYKLPEHNLVGSERCHKDRRPTSGATKEMLKDSTLSSHLSFISSFARPRDPLAIMPTLTVPATVTSPPYALLALALLKGCEIQWDLESGDRGEVKYDSVSGTQAVRVELEKGIPGKEVRQEDSSPKSKFRPEEPSHESPKTSKRRTDVRCCRSLCLPCRRCSSRPARSKMCRTSSMRWTTTSPTGRL